MNRFGYARAATLDDAFALLTAPGAQIIAGGADLVPLLADDLAAPATLVDIARIPDLRAISFNPAGGLWLGATATLAEVMAHPVVQAHYNVLSQAIGESASPQVRNLATIGGNLLQQPRCPYYRDREFACLRRGPGPTPSPTPSADGVGRSGRDESRPYNDGSASGELCSALVGETSRHALFGYGAPDPHATCVAVHPSDAVNALAALDAQVVLRDASGERCVAVTDFFVAPADDPHRGTVIAPGEIIVAINVPLPPEGARGTYVKIRDRAAYEFAIVSAAAVIAEQRGVVAHARLVLGGVAWGLRRVPEAEAALRGQPRTPAAAARAAQIALQGAQPLPDNEYKIALAQTALRRAILGE
jgi:xanthine dehydrogenase YagS FAD-binding subunit